MFRENNLLTFVIMFLVTFLFCLNFLVNHGRLVTFDGLTHMSNIAQFNSALKSGDFPVRWLDKSANYGMPFGMFSEQLVPYLGALLLFIFHNTLLVFNLIIFIFAFGSCLALYLFLRECVDWLSAITGTVLFSFAPYRLVNIYTRGAIPEFAASLFLPIILLAIKKRNWILLTTSLALLFLTHPISAIVFSIPVFLYFVYLKRNILGLVFAATLALGLSAFYLLPLVYEFKYLYAGLSPSIFVPGSSLDAPGYNYLQVGAIEVIIMIFGLFFIRKIKILKIIYITLAVYLFLVSRLATPLFYLIRPLGEVQHQWRFLSGIIFIAPMIIALVLNSIEKKFRYFIAVLMIILVLVLRVPMARGLSYMASSESDYYSSKINLYSEEMNTIWTGPTAGYPVKNIKGEIIGGNGQITSRVEKNSWREYKVSAKTEVRMIDNTFYFPGWKVFVDGMETPIEFQDINYRGVITYKVPAGGHTILVKFEDTKVRRLADIISVISLLLLLFLSQRARSKYK